MPPPPAPKQADSLPEPVQAAGDAQAPSVTAARFSGTETLLAFDGLSATALEATVSIPGSFEGFPLDVWVPGPGDTRLLRLPPLEPGADYDGTVPLTITTGDDQWTFQLPGPPPDEVDDALRIEPFEPLMLEVEGADVTISGQRSTSETVVEVRGRRPIGQLVLSPSSGRGIWPHFSQPLPGDDTGGAGVVASFPATSFGEPIEVDLGQLEVIDGETTLQVTIDAGRVLSRAPGGPAAHGEFTVQDWEVLDGDPDQVLALTRGAQRQPLREWVGVKVRGTFHGAEADRMLDQDGERLRVGTIITNYSRDAEGTISPGETHLQAFVTRPEEFEHLTLILGGGDRVAPGPYVVTLEPADTED